MNIAPRGKGLSLSFGIEDLTKEVEDELLRQEIVQLLADRSIGVAELAWKVRQIYIKAGLPEGAGSEGLVKWIEKL